MEIKGINGTNLTADRINTFAEECSKRSGGGSAQMGEMSFEEIAEVIIPNSKGYDKKEGSPYSEKIYALSRIFSERRWPLPKRAILIAGVRKYCVDPKDGFIPFAPGTIDIEAAVEMNPEHREIEISVTQREGPFDSAISNLSNIVGFATEYGNGDNSLETIIPIPTPGIWKKIRDIQFERPTGMVIVTSNIVLWCEEMSINNLFIFPEYLGSVKMIEAIKIAKQLI